MQRDLNSLGTERFDVLIVGAGSHGACVARDAASRGLKVALIDKGDFCSATSHNSLKLIHGGIRYLQHLDLRRVRQSILERRFWLRAAPHLVRPLELIIPTLGHGTRGPEALRAAMRVHELLGWDRNHGVSEGRRIPRSKILSRGECLARIPGMEPTQVSGGAAWYDGQMIDANRLVLECVQSAVRAGAEAANYVAVNKLVLQGSKVVGAQTRDELTGTEFEIRAQTVVNATGPWISHVLEGLPHGQAPRPIALARNLNLVTRQMPFESYAVGIPSQRASDATIGNSERLFFVIPWLGRNVVGTTHVHFDGHPEDYRITDDEINKFIDEVNASYPSYQLHRDDIVYAYGGLTPAASGESNRGEVRRARHGHVLDHSRSHGIGGLISMVSVKWTTARLLAEWAVDLVFSKLGRAVPPCVSKTQLLPGSEGYTDHDKLLDEARALAPWAHEADLDLLVTRHGCGMRDVLKDRATPEVGAHESLARLECEHALQQEMAMRLEDVFVRRTVLAETGTLDWATLEWCAMRMQSVLGWSDATREAELRAVGSLVREDRAASARIRATEKKACFEAYQ